MITPENLQLFFTAFNTQMGLVFNETPVQYPAIASTIPCSTEQMAFAWIGRLDRMREWIGPRVTHEPAAETYLVTPKAFELTESIDRFKLDDDQLGVYYQMLPQMAGKARKDPDFQIRDLLQNRGAWTGSYQKGLDGLTFFNTAHPVDVYDSAKGTYVNDFTGGGVSISYVNAAGGPVTVLTGGAFGITSVSTMYEYGRTLKGQDGEPLGIMFDTVLIPPQLEIEANLIFASAFMAPPAWGTITGQVGAADNPMLRFGLKPMVWDLLGGDSSTFYMLDTRKIYKPILWIEREPVRFAYRISDEDPVVFDSHKYLYGAWARYAPGWSHSFLMARSGP